MKVYDVAKYQILMHQRYNSISEVFTINTVFYLCAKAIFSFFPKYFFLNVCPKNDTLPVQVSQKMHFFFILQYQTKSQDANKAKFDIKPNTNDSKLRSAVFWETSCGRSRVSRGYKDTF